MNSSVIIDQREKGQFLVSMGTSLALESLFGVLTPSEMQTEMKDADSQLEFGVPHWKEYDEVWMNFRTLFRNMVASVKNESSSLLTADDYANALLEEFSIIQQTVGKFSSGRVTPRFYVCNYSAIESFYKHANMKVPHTPKQLFYVALERNTIEIVLQRLEKNNDILHVFDMTLPLNGQRTLLLSHYPIDLLNAKNFKSLALLESNTGAIKTKALWYTKLKDGKNLVRIPFNKMTIQLFGDSGGMFAPYPRMDRDKLIGLSVKYEWNSTTTKDRILQGVALMRDPIFEELIRRLYA